MKTRLYTRLWIAMLLVTMYLTPPFSIPLQRAEAQGDHPRFLITPYFGSLGTNGINSYFDHQYPTYTGSPNNSNDIFTRYDGQQWPHDTSISNCSHTSGNCYDGHNGYDFALSFEPVIAAAAGTVVYADWDKTDCHNGGSCGYGLIVEIEHVINNVHYRTDYGHLTTLAVHYGQSVSQGQIIGTSGSTGSSSGPHLHFDVNIFLSSTWKVIDPFGWQPTPGALVQNDPWDPAQYSYGATSWCMWIDGEWGNLCEGNQYTNPILKPISGGEIVVDDTTNNLGGFNKGYGGYPNHPCVGLDNSNPPCTGWYETSGVGIGGHAFRMVADGYTTPDQWASWQSSGLLSSAMFYEIYVYIPTMYFNDDEYSFTWQAKYTVVAADATYTTLVDEGRVKNVNYNPHDKWLSIGVYALNSSSKVYLTDATGEYNGHHCTLYSYNNWCRMAVDAVKFVRVGNNYASDLSNYQNGLVTTLYVRNDSDIYQKISVRYLDQNGNLARSYDDVCGLRSFQWCWLPVNSYNRIPVNTSGSAILSGVQPFSVVALNNKNDHGLDLDNGFNGYAGSYAFESLGTTLYAPTAYKNSGNINTTIHIVNEGETSASITIYFKGRAGYSDIPWSPPNSIPSHGKLILTLNSITQIPYSWVGSMVIFSNNGMPIMAKIMDTRSTDNATRTYNAAVGGGTLLYGPVLYRRNYNISSAIAVQNIGGSETDVNLIFYDRGGSYRTTYTFHGLDTWQAGGISLNYISGLPDNWPGSVRIQSTSGQPLVAVVFADTTKYGYGDSTAYNTALDPRSIVILPYASKNKDGKSSSYIIQNVNTTSGLNITAYYYDLSGSLTYSTPLTPLNSYGSMGYNQAYDTNLGYSWEGSIKLVANSPYLVAVFRNDTSNSISAATGLGR